MTAGTIVNVLGGRRVGAVWSELPADVRYVVVLGGGDEPGEAVAHDAGLAGSVRIARPSQGFDFNDVPHGRAFCQVEDAA